MKRVQNQAVMSIKTRKNHKKCEIVWNDVSYEQWQGHFNKIEYSNLLQSVPYGCVVAQMNQQRLRHGIILIDEQEAGVVQILEAGLFRNMVHGLIIDRGPLWFDGRGGVDDMACFLDAFCRKFPKRLGRRIRFIPEVADTQNMHDLLVQYGFQKKGTHNYQTYWLDIKPDMDALRQNLSGRWLRQLKKAEKSNLEIVWSDEGAHFAWLMNNYGQDRDQRNYDGASVKTMIALSREFSRGKNMLIGTALLEGEPIASILLLNHGRASTYQIGYSSDIGREKRAHYALLWRALSELKERNIDAFDLGGVNDESAKGVKVFKEGMGGALHEMLGFYS